MVNDGDIDGVETVLGKILSHMSLEHPLYPNYGFNFSCGRMVSIPRTDTAKKLYPVKYKFTGTLLNSNQYVIDGNCNPDGLCLSTSATDNYGDNESRKVPGEYA